MTIHVKSGDNSKEIEIYARSPESSTDATPVLKKAGTLICHCDEMTDGSTAPALFNIEWLNSDSSLASTTLTGSIVVI